MNRLLLFFIVCTAVAIGAAIAAGGVSAAGSQSNPGSVGYYNQRIVPILKQNCVKCHGETKTEGGLRLDSYSQMMLGGEDGAVVLAGNPNRSFLILAVRSIGFGPNDFHMPPKSYLPKSDIDALVAWVAAGAVGADLGSPAPPASPAQTPAAPAPPAANTTAQAAPNSTMPDLNAAPTNLQVLPKELTNAQVRTIMNEWAEALGTDCSHCHVPDLNHRAPNGRPRMDYASDQKEEKRIARVMYKMTENINRAYLDTVPNSGLPVTCSTCHRGHLAPEPYVPPASATPQAASDSSTKN